MGTKSLLAALQPSANRWQLGYKSRDGKTVHEHLDGMSWDMAPLPRRLHRCTPQTRGKTDRVASIERCACGATALNNGPFFDKNSRRRR